MNRLLISIATLIASVSLAYGQVVFDYNPPPNSASVNTKRLDLNAELDGINSVKIDFLDIDLSSELRAVVTDEVGTGSLMFGLAAAMSDDLGCTASQVVRRNAGDTAFECASVAGTLAATDIDTSSELRAIVTDEVGTGPLMFGIAATMSDDITCGASQVLRRDVSDTAWECATFTGGLSAADIDTSAELRGVLTDELGTGVLFFLGAPAADDQAFVTSSTTAGAWILIPDSDLATQKLQYDTATNLFSAGTDDDVPEAGDFGALSATSPIIQSGGTISTSISTARLVGRTTAAAGVMEQIAVDATLSLAALTLGVIDVTCTGCLGTTEIAALDTADITTGTLVDARVDGSIEADELVLVGDVDGVANVNDIDETAVEAELETVIDLQDLQGILTVAKGGHGSAPGADDQVFVADSVSAGTWRALIDSDLATQKLQYDVTTNLFSVGTDDDIPDAADYTNLSAVAPITQAAGTVSTSIATGTLVGRTTAATGVMEAITPNATLSLTGLALGVVDVTCTGCLGTTEIAALDTADVTTGIFGDARIDGSLEADEVNPILGSQTSGNYVASTTAGAGIAALTVAGETTNQTIAFDFTDAGVDPALGAAECRFSNEGASAAGLVCEGDTANTFETRLRLTDPTADRLMTVPDADSNTVQPLACTGTDKISTISALGVITCTSDDDVPEAGDFGALALTGDVTSTGLATTIAANSVALTTDTTGNYAAGDAEAGAALTGDSATAFFTVGALEMARGGTGNGAAASDDQALISDGTSASTWRTIPDSDAATQKLQYDIATNTFSAGTDDDVPDAGDYGTLVLTGDVTSSGLATTIAANSVTLTTDTTGNYVLTLAAGLGIAVTGADAEGSTKTVAFDFSDAGADPALSADECRFTNNTTLSRNLVCEGDVADALETGIAFTAPTTTDKVMTIPDADTNPVQPLTCTSTDKVSAISATGVITCTADAGGAGSGDNIRIEDGDNVGTFTASADGDFEDSGDINFVRAAGPPDLISALVRADSVALTTDTTGNYAAGTAEAGDALTGDTATAFFAAGTIEVARLPSASDTAEGIIETATAAETETGTDLDRATTPAGVLAAISGLHSIYIPAGAMLTEVTTGCVDGTVETTTNDVMYNTKDCDGTAQEGVQFPVIGMPKSWNEGSLTMRIDWTNPSGTGNVIWLSSCLARSNDDPIDTAFGTEISVTDTVLAAGDVHQSPETAAITAGGTAAENDNLWCRVQRDADAAGDTLNAVDARIIGVRMLVNTNAFTDD